MKKLVALFIIYIVTVFYSNAQNTSENEQSQKEISFFSYWGVSASYNVATRNFLEYLNNFETQPKYSSELTNSFGINLNIFHYKKWDIFQSIEFSKYRYIANIETYKTIIIKEEHSYVNYPTYIEYSLTKNKIQPTILAGFSINYLIKSFATFFDEQKKYNKTINLDDSRHHFNPTLNIGLGLNREYLNSMIKIAIKYDIGLLNIVRYSPTTNVILFEYLHYDNKYKTNTFSLTIKYNFNFY